MGTEGKVTDGDGRYGGRQGAVGVVLRSCIQIWRSALGPLCNYLNWSEGGRDGEVEIDSLSSSDVIILESLFTV